MVGAELLSSFRHGVSEKAVSLSEVCEQKLRNESQQWEPVTCLFVPDLFSAFKSWISAMQGYFLPEAY